MPVRRAQPLHLRYVLLMGPAREWLQALASYESQTCCDGDDGSAAEEALQAAIDYIRTLERKLYP
jgi:hypothetical protein